VAKVIATVARRRRAGTANNFQVSINSVQTRVNRDATPSNKSGEASVVPAYRIYELHARGRVILPPASSSAKTTRMLSGRSNLRPTDTASRLWRALVSSLGYMAAAETLLSLRGNCGMAQCMEALK
jgi:hypothetical protein